MTITLPQDLAPSLVQRVEEFLAEVALVEAPPLVIDLTYRGPRCVVCHQGGKLGGHHGPDGVEWIHRACHRQLHRKGLPHLPGKARARLLERRRTAS